MDLIHSTVGIYFNNCYWWTPLGASTTYNKWSTKFYFEIIENNPFLIRKIQKNKFCASFQFYFLRVFLVNKNIIF